MLQRPNNDISTKEQKKLHKFLPLRRTNRPPKQHELSTDRRKEAKEEPKSNTLILGYGRRFFRSQLIWPLSLSRRSLASYAWDPDSHRQLSALTLVRQSRMQKVSVLFFSLVLQWLSTFPILGKEEWIINLLSSSLSTSLQILFKKLWLPSYSKRSEYCQ